MFLLKNITIFVLLFIININKMTKEERILQIKPLWEQGLGVNQIGKKIKLTNPNVVRYLDIIYGKSREKRFIYGPSKYTLTEDFFEIIDTEAKAYFLGLLAADGNLSKSQNSVRISLHEKDKKILETFRKHLKYTKPLTFLKKSKINWNRADQYILEVSSSIFRKTLEKYGLTPNKSLTLKFPNNVPKEFLNHYIRGYFDGDGCIYIDKNFSKPMGIFAGSHDYCLELVNVLQKEEIKGRFRKHSSIECYYTRVSSNSEVLKLYNFLYKDATIFLERKKEKFDKWIDKRNDTRSKKSKIKN